MARLWLDEPATFRHGDGGGPAAGHLGTQPAPAAGADASEPVSRRVVSPEEGLYRAYVDNAMARYATDEYVPLSGPARFEHAHPATVMAYYLPQFHPIPENDLWWGAGFTEWRNVARAFPTFEGHYQPRVPGELGYYDLRVADIMKRQVALARQYAISGFCFHFYWFGGKRLLEAPILSFLEDKSLDLTFSLCWANENWSRRWDGGNNEMLMEQTHSAEDDLAFIRYLDRYFRDRRYLRIDGKPVLTVYRADILPERGVTIARWRAEAQRLGYPGLYLIATTAFAFADHEAFGFDASTEFPPHNLHPPVIDWRLEQASIRDGGAVFDYSETVDGEVAKVLPQGMLHPCVFPCWDNSPRKPTYASVFHGATPAAFGRWLDGAFRRAAAHPEPERLVFINAWNEWAEGAYLEPDARFGYAWLAAVRDAVLRHGDTGRTSDGAAGVR